MSKIHMIAYAIVSGVTPMLVLISCLQSTDTFSSSPAAQPLQSIAWLGRLATFKPEAFAKTYAAAGKTPASQSQARIVARNDQFALEFYHPFSTAAHMPDLMLVLATSAIPNDNFVMGDRNYIVGELQSLAGKQRYPIPLSVNVSQYLSVLIWCPELDAIMGYAPLTIEV